MTQSQAADLLGVSRASLARWVREGKLTTRYAQRGESIRMLTLYDPAELSRMPRKYRSLPEFELGELTARVFEMLDDGKSMKQMVIETREPVAKLEGIRESWLDAGGSALVINPEAKAELERFCGPFQTVGDLVALVTQKLGCVIVADVDTSASDAQIEHAIVTVLEEAQRP